MNIVKELDLVALLQDIPSEKLTRGDIGTIVDDPGNGYYLVEFSDRLGQTYALLTLQPEQFLVLHRIERTEIAA